MKITCVTGRGFIKNSLGEIVSKTDFLRGSVHELQAGYSYDEASETELGAWTPVITREEEVLILISKKIIELTTSELIKEGKITVAESDKVKGV